jgi:hypothetical protein
MNSVLTLLCPFSSAVQRNWVRAKEVEKEWEYVLFDVCFWGPTVCEAYWNQCPSLRPCGLRRGSAAARLMRLHVRIAPVAWIFLQLCVLCTVWERSLWQADHSSRGGCRLWRVVVCDLETSRMRKPWPKLGFSATGKNIKSNFALRTAFVSISIFWILVPGVGLFMCFVCFSK